MILMSCHHHGRNLGFRMYTHPDDLLGDRLVWFSWVSWGTENLGSYKAVGEVFKLSLPCQ